MNMTTKRIAASVITLLLLINILSAPFETYAADAAGLEGIEAAGTMEDIEGEDDSNGLTNGESIPTSSEMQDPAETPKPAPVQEDAPESFEDLTETPDPTAEPGPVANPGMEPEPAADPATTEPMETSAETPRDSYKETILFTAADGRNREVTVTVEADGGAFPEGATLTVTTVPATEQAEVNAAVEEERSAGTNVVASYTFDVSMRDAEGAELQPENSGNVTVSFAMAEIANDNLDIQIYHIHEEDLAAKSATSEEETAADDEETAPLFSAVSLDVETDGETATASTDGFSYYTVEFTYNNLTYVMDGDGTVALTDILASVGLHGSVTAVEISDSALFSASNEGGTWTVTAHQAFSTSEWMRVTIDGIVYEITVTDDYIDYNGNSVSVDGVIQGNNADWTSSMPVASIYIDENIINNSTASRNSAVVSITTNPNNAFSVGSNQSSSSGPYTGNNYINFNLKTYFDKKLNLNGGYPTVSSFVNTEHNIPINITFTYKNAAAVFDSGTWQYKDVVITYTDLYLAFQTTMTQTDLNWFWDENPVLSLFSGNTIGLSYNAAGNGSHNQRTGIRFDANIQIVDPVSGEAIDGTFYYPMVDIDQNKYNAPGFVDIKNSNQYRNYSEQVTLTGGLASDIYIPGADGGYKCYIEKTTAGYLIAAGITDNNTSASGFQVLADNSTGISLTYAGYAGAYGNRIDTELLYAGTVRINYELAASSDDGGTIYTTTTGNHDGTLSSGTKLGTDDTNSPYIIATTPGQKITYTMTPNPGYRLKSVYVKKTETDVLSDINSNTNLNNTVIYEVYSGAYKCHEEFYVDGSGRYTYTFENIQSNASIHVEWEKTNLTVKKEKTDDSPDSAAGTFTFRMKLTEGTTTYPGIETALTNAGLTKVEGTTDEYEFTLSVGGEINLEGIIPLGWGYVITETDLPRNWSFDSSTSNASVNDFDGEEAVVFKNKYTPPAEHDLTVSKTVAGVMGNKAADWTFTLTLKDASGNPVTDLAAPSGAANWSDSNKANGEYTFTLQHGESLTISGLPDGGQYTVAEKDVTGGKTTDGYTVTIIVSGEDDDGTVTAASGAVTDTALTGAATLAFTNTLNAVVPTGISNKLAPVLAGLGVAALLLAALLPGRRRRRHE